MEIAGGAFRNSFGQPYQWGPKDHLLGARRTQGPPPLSTRSVGPQAADRRLPTEDPIYQWALPPLSAPRGDEGMSHTESTEPGDVPPLRPQRSLRSPKKTEPSATVSISVGRVALSRAVAKLRLDIPPLEEEKAPAATSRAQKLEPTTTTTKS
jgi:hypothetical protein